MIFIIIIIIKKFQTFNTYKCYILPEAEKKCLFEQFIILVRYYFISSIKMIITHDINSFYLPYLHFILKSEFLSMFEYYNGKRIIVYCHSKVQILLNFSSQYLNMFYEHLKSSVESNLIKLQ